VTTPDAALPDVIVALIRAALPGVTVYDGIVPAEPADRYVVVYIDNGTRRAVAACNDSDSVTTRWQVTSVAPDRQQTAWLSDRVADSIVDVEPNVAGWSCGRIEHTYSTTPERDETVAAKPAVWMADRYSILAARA
jgi:hypothetical protein